MAVSTRDLHALLGRTGTDGWARPATSAEILPLFPRQRGLGLDVDLPNLCAKFEQDTGILWARMKHRERACYTPELMRDMREFQLRLRDTFAEVPAAEVPVRWLAWTSDAPKAWSLGGDLTNFTRMIRERDDAALRAYAHLAIDILYDNYIGADLPILTVALIQGDAVGGGFEAMLTDDVVIAERGVKFGLPEILFNLFPGMGAYSFLRRKVGITTARQLIEDGLSRSADEMKELGLVDVVCEPGQGEAAFRAYVAENEGRFKTLRTLEKVRRRVDPVTHEELAEVVDMWTDLAMELSEADLRRMDCLARVQQRKRVGA